MARPVDVSDFTRIFGESRRVVCHEFQDFGMAFVDARVAQVALQRNRSHVGEQGGSSILAELGLHGVGQPVEDVAVSAAAGFDDR